MIAAVDPAAARDRPGALTLRVRLGLFLQLGEIDRAAAWDSDLAAGRRVGDGALAEVEAGTRVAWNVGEDRAHQEAEDEADHDADDQDGREIADALVLGRLHQPRQAEIQQYEG